MLQTTDRKMKCNSKDKLLSKANKNRSTNCNSLPLATWKSKAKYKLNLLLHFCPWSLSRNIYCHTLQIIGCVGPSSCRRFLTFSFMHCWAECSIHPSIPYRGLALGSRALLARWCWGHRTLPSHHWCWCHVHLEFLPRKMLLHLT